MNLEAFFASLVLTLTGVWCCLDALSASVELQPAASGPWLWGSFTDVISASEAPTQAVAGLALVTPNLERFIARFRNALRRRDKPSIFSPNYLHLYALAREVRTFIDGQGGRILDLGAGDSPYRSFLKSRHHYIRLDLNRASLPDINADVLRLPLQSERADMIICTQAAECVDDPRALVAECHRVLKPGGTIVFSAPFFWPNQPTPESDNYRFTLGSMQRLFATFTDVEVRPNGNAWLTLAQVASRCVYRATGAAGLPFYVLMNLVGRGLDCVSSDSSLTTGYTVRAVKPGMSGGDHRSSRETHTTNLGMHPPVPDVAGVYAATVGEEHATVSV